MIGDRYRFVSPHLDDVALSCARLASQHSGSRMTTIFSGGPDAITPLTEWDRAGWYFHDGDDVMAIRRAEDQRAADVVGATCEHLDFWDGQYRVDRYGYRGATGAQLCAEITDALAAIAAGGPDAVWFLPLGLGHDDHRLASDACLAFASTLDFDVYVYGELPYWIEDGGEVADRLRALERRGILLTEDPSVATGAGLKLKREAVACYRSQRRSLGSRARRAVRTPERFWRHACTIA